MKPGCNLLIIVFINFLHSFEKSFALAITSTVITVTVCSFFDLYC